MRIRYKPWARPELEASSFYEDNPDKWIGKWKEHYIRNNQPFHIELGCGKGNFIAELAIRNPNINYLAIDMVDPMLGLAKRNIESSFQEANLPIDNVLLTRWDIERIPLILNKEDAVSRIYINFCNPWPRGKHQKKRLTHTRQLEKYRTFLVPNAEIYFKTDDDALFQASIRYFKETGFTISKSTYDLHSEKDVDNIETEHEKMFSEQGIKIKALIAIWEGEKECIKEPIQDQFK